MTLLRAAIAWHVFELTHSAFYLGLVGIVSFVPTLAFTLVGGAVADSFDRRRVINSAQLVLLATGFLLLHSARAGSAALLEIFIAILCGAVASSFEAPSRIALLPAMVPREQFPRAVTISSTGTALAFASGPALAGSLIAVAGIGAAYAAYLVLVALAFLGIARLPPIVAAPAERSAVSVRAIREGLVFVWRNPVILGCMSVDMFAVIFGGASALLPIYAKTILHAGPSGYGMLTASFEVGALVMSVLLMLRPPAENAGRTLLIAVSVFGVATIVFGLSRVFALSVSVYLIAGMADQISVVMRSTAIQLSTPDELRGRVSAVNMVFIAASNQLGAAESGFVAHLVSPTFAVVSGGFACLLVVALMAWRLPELRRYRLG
jgi:MFS family permease